MQQLKFRGLRVSIRDHFSWEAGEVPRAHVEAPLPPAPLGPASAAPYTALHELRVSTSFGSAPRIPLLPSPSPCPFQRPSCLAHCTCTLLFA